MTLLFTDVEGSTKLLQEQGTAYSKLLADHHAIVRRSLDDWRGHEVDTAGDGFFAVFQRASEAAAAAVQIQESMRAHPWPGSADVRVRMGIHTGEPARGPAGYVGIDVHRAARICAVAHGGQVLLSRASWDLIRRDPERRWQAVDLGEHSLKDLEEPEHLFQLLVSDDAEESAQPPRTGGAKEYQLPAEVTSFVGREQELEGLAALLGNSDVRLVTLTGPGGTGKTRLALRLAHRMEREFPDGARFVPLAGITDPARFAEGVVAALELSGASQLDPLERVAEWIDQRSILLILDNFEQIAPAAPDVAELLARCPQVRLVVTSREVLRISGEHHFPVPPLPAPPAQAELDGERLSGFPAVSLFVDRARARKPDFTLDDRNAAAVAQICARLDGLPLALELGAARIRLFSPEDLLKRLGSRLDVLRGGNRDAEPRHQTLRQAISWSYDLLPRSERAVFHRLAVFVDGVSLAAAEAVCGSSGADIDVIEALLALTDKSLLRQVESVDGQTRFEMLETIREFALEQLVSDPDRPVVERAHAEHFLHLAQEAAPHLTGPDQGSWIRRVTMELSNLRAAMDFAVRQSDVELALSFGAALWRFWVVTGSLLEGRARLESLLGVPGGDPHGQVRATVLNGLGTVLHELSYTARAREVLEESRAIWEQVGDHRELSHVLNNLSWVSMFANEGTRARELGERALVMCREHRNERGASVALTNLGWLAMSGCRPAEAKKLLGESMKIRRRIGDHRGAAFNLTTIGWCESDAGRHEIGLANAREALEVLRGLGDRQLTANALHTMAVVMLSAGRHEETFGILEESLALWRGTGNRTGIAETLDALGHAQLAAGRLEQARSNLDEAIRLWDEVGFNWGRATVRLTRARWELTDGAAAAARQVLGEAAELFASLDHDRGVAEVCEFLGVLLAREGETGEAVELLGAADRLRSEHQTPRSAPAETMVEELEGELDSSMSPEALSEHRTVGSRRSREEILGILASLLGSAVPDGDGAG